jgi:hypothetical protein
MAIGRHQVDFPCCDNNVERIQARCYLKDVGDCVESILKKTTGAFRALEIARHQTIGSSDSSLSSDGPLVG